MDLSGLGVMGGGVMPGYLAGRKSILELQALERAVAAEGAAGGALSSMPGGIPYAMPMPGAQGPQTPFPGQPSQPRFPSQAPGGTPTRQLPFMPQGAGGGHPYGGGGQMPPQGAPGPAGAHGGYPGGMPQRGALPPMGGPAAGGGMSFGGGGTVTGGLSIQQLAARIKSQNPGIDPATLFEAVKEANALLNPESKMLLQYLMNQQRVEGAKERTEKTVAGAGEREAGREGAAEKRTKLIIEGRAAEGAAGRASREKIAGEREADVRRGQDIRAETAKEGRLALMERTSFIQDRIDSRTHAKGVAKTVADAAKAKYKTLMAQRMEATDKINETLMTDPTGKGLEEAYAAKSKLDAQIVAFWQQAQKQGVMLPRPSALASEAESMGAGDQEGGAAPEAAAGASQDSPAEPKTQEEYDALPSGAYFRDDEGVKRKP